MAERLQKLLSRAGIASRRHAEELIVAGRVSVNNQVVRELGTRVEPSKDLVAVDGKLVEVAAQRAYYLLYKPTGVLTTLEDPRGRPCVGDIVRKLGRRVYPVGRLDWDAEGALLLVDDGELANRLLHPRYEVRRTYLAKVKGTPTDAALDKLRAGIRLEDGPAKPLEVTLFDRTEANTWVRLVVAEGRPHLVKRLCAAIGHPVVRLFRPFQATISVAGMRPGDVRPLSPEEVRRVRAVAEGKPAPEPELRLPARRHGHGPGRDEAEPNEPREPPPRFDQRRPPGPRSSTARAPRGGSARPRGGRPTNRSRRGGR